MIDFPPPRFDHPYHGPVIETILTLLEIKKFCRNPDALACLPFPPNFKNDKCFIYLPSDVNKITQNLLRKHEIGHCNGWKH